MCGRATYLGPFLSRLWSEHVYKVLESVPLRMAHHVIPRSTLAAHMVVGPIMCYGGVKPSTKFMEMYSSTTLDKLGKVSCDDLLFVFRISNQLFQSSELDIMFIIGDRSPRRGYGQKTSRH